MKNETLALPLSVELAVPEEEQIRQGADRAQFTVVYGAILPIQGPQGGPIVFPAGTISFPLDRNTLEKVGQDMLDAAQKLPKQSNIAVAQSLQGVDQIAAAQQELRG